LLNVEVDVVDGSDVADNALQKPVPDREKLSQAAHFEDVHRAISHWRSAFSRTHNVADG
jgi:hypothetical protein